MFLPFLKSYRYRDASFQAFLSHLVTLNDLSKNDLICFYLGTKRCQIRCVESNSFRTSKMLGTLSHGNGNVSKTKHCNMHLIQVFTSVGRCTLWVCTRVHGGCTSVLRSPCISQNNPILIIFELFHCDQFLFLTTI